jgi:GNAT superfamily N-acetyltransferase
MKTDMSIAPCEPSDVPLVFEIINESAMAYKGVIPADAWHEPYMPMAELTAEISRGVRFFGYRLERDLVAVMGIEDVKDVTLIRHAYVRPAHRRAGFGRALLAALCTLTERPVLIGTWKAATWAIRFYEKNGFAVVDGGKRKQLLDTYWAVPERQKEVAVVLADAKARAVL